MKNLKKLYAVLMLVSFVLVSATPAFASGLANITDIAGGNGEMAVGEKATIYFGNYWQSYKGSGDRTVLDNYNKEGIKWRVLSNAGGKTLLLSDKALYGGAFNSWSFGNKWEYSKIRKTLNNRTDNGFAKDAFSDKEYAVIAETTHTAGGRKRYPDYDIKSTDKIFVLSDEEVSNTAYGFEDQPIGTKSDTRTAVATAMAQNVKMYGNTAPAYDRDNVFWWLRSPGSGTSLVYGIHKKGAVYDFYDVDSVNTGVRPAINLNQESVLFLSAAVGGKEAGACDGTFGLADYDGADGWKLTLKDETIPAPDITNVEIKGNKLSVTYSGVQTGANMYLSALLYNETDEMINYAKVADAAEKSEGTAEIPLCGIESRYKIRFFTEQATGGEQTDYASELSEEFDIATKKSSSDGCNAGFGAVALLGVLGLFYRKKK